MGLDVALTFSIGLGFSNFSKLDSVKFYNIPVNMCAALISCVLLGKGLKAIRPEPQSPRRSRKPRPSARTERARYPTKNLMKT